MKHELSSGAVGWEGAPRAGHPCAPRGLPRPQPPAETHLLLCPRSRPSGLSGLATVVTDDRNWEADFLQIKNCKSPNKSDIQHELFVKSHCL